MIEKDLKLMEGAGFIWRVSLKNEAGEVLRGDKYAVYGGFGAPWVMERSYAVQEEDGVWLVRMHGVYACNGGRYQLMACCKATGVEWMLAKGCVEVERRVGHCGGGVVDAAAGVIECVLHHETLEAEVVLGESTAACVDAWARVAAGVEEAKTAKDTAWRAVERAEGEAVKAEKARDGAARSAEDASMCAMTADERMADAEAAAERAKADADEAALALQAVREDAAKVEARAADAAASAKAAAESASDAIEAAEKAAAGGNMAELLAADNVFTGSNVFADNFTVLPMGVNTVLGAPACGLHVSASGGLQLFGTHFMLSDMWSENALKVVNDAVCLTANDAAAIGFDYANKVVFRTMPNDGSDANDSAGAVYEFQGWQWADDSHTERVACPVDVRKASAGALADDSVLNRAEGDKRWVRGHLVAASPNNYTNAAASVSASYGSSLAVGGYSSCNRNDATAIGFHARTTNTGGVAIGCEAYSSAIDGFAIGTYTRATAQNAVALGRDAKANAKNSIAIGYNITASKEAAITIGVGSAASGRYGTAVGYNCKATGVENAASAYYGGAAFGQSCTASMAGAVAIGHGCMASTGFHACALGAWAKATARDALVLSAYGEAQGEQSTAVGYKAMAKAVRSTALGASAEVADAGCAVIAAWNAGGNVRTQLYLIGAGSALAEQYYPTASGMPANNGCLAFVTKKTDGTVVASGMKKLCELLTDNAYDVTTGAGFVATLAADDEPVCAPFMPSDGFAPIDTAAPVVPMPEELPEEE